MKIELGSVVQDPISGLIGVAVTRTEYLHDTPGIGVQARELRDGKPLEPVYISEARLQIVFESYE